MKKLILLLAFLALTPACWDHNHDGWGFDKHTLTVTVEDTCHHPPFRIYLDGKDSNDKVGEIEESGGTVLIILDDGWHDLNIRDDEGDWIFEDEVHLDEDRTVRVDC